MKLSGMWLVLGALFALFLGWWTWDTSRPGTPAGAVTVNMLGGADEAGNGQILRLDKDGYVLGMQEVLERLRKAERCGSGAQCWVFRESDRRWIACDTVQRRDEP
jgi:hypothetical protein